MHQQAETHIQKNVQGEMMPQTGLVGRFNCTSRQGQKPPLHTIYYLHVTYICKPKLSSLANPLLLTFSSSAVQWKRFCKGYSRQLICCCPSTHDILLPISFFSTTFSTLQRWRICCNCCLIYSFSLPHSKTKLNLVQRPLYRGIRNILIHKVGSK